MADYSPRLLAYLRECLHPCGPSREALRALWCYRDNLPKKFAAACDALKLDDSLLVRRAGNHGS